MKFLVKKPIAGFEDIMEVELEKVDDIFAVLKDEKGNILFSLVNPFLFKKDFDFEVPSDVRVLLDLNENADVDVYCNVVRAKDVKDYVINFKAPFIFNKSNNTTAQVILDKEIPEKIGYFIKE